MMLVEEVPEEEDEILLYVYPFDNHSKLGRNVLCATLLGCYHMPQYRFFG